MNALRIPGLVAGLLLGFAGAAAAQLVHVVGPVAGPGIDFTSLPDATAAALNGDVVLVLPGTYPGTANITNKSISVVGIADGGGERPHVETLMVKNLDPGMTVLVRGLASNTDLDVAVTPLWVLNCSGAALLEDCAFDMGAGPAGLGSDGMIITDSSRVVFSRCLLTGTDGVEGSTLSFAGSTVLRITNSTVTLDACTVQGGDGGDGLAYPSTFLHRPSSPGGAALTLLSGTLTVRGSVVTGGQGGDGASEHGNPFCVAASAGGAGVQLDGLLRRVDTAIAGGAPGVAAPCGGGASAGPDVNLLGGSVEALGGAVGRLELSAVIADGGSASLGVQGTPGDLVIVLHALGGSGLWLGGLKGTLVPSVPFVSLTFVPVPAGGELDLDFDLPPVLPPGIGGVLLVNQALLVPPVGKGVLSSATCSVLVAEVP